MSFSSELKEQLCEIPPENLCCRYAQGYGMLLYAREFSGRGIKLSTSCTPAVSLLADFCRKELDVEPTLITGKDGGQQFRISRRGDVAKVLRAFGHSPDEVAFTLNDSNLEDECCLPHFLRGVFLACGRMTDPARGYHLEFSVGRVKAASALETLLKSMGYPPLSSIRGNSCLLYYKDSETIEELLTVMGAVGGALEVMNTKVYRDLRNRVNRLTNCEASNIGKTVQASREQLKAIEYLRKNGGLRSLPDELRQIAKLRVSNPEASLSEIGQMCEPPLSRSGVNHRLSKLLVLAEQQAEKETLQSKTTEDK